MDCRFSARAGSDIVGNQQVILYDQQFLITDPSDDHGMGQERHAM